MKNKNDKDDYIYFIVLVFEGKFQNGLKNGKGKEYDQEGNIIFDGEYQKGKKFKGTGKEFDVNGNIIFEGEYENGIKWQGIGKEFDKRGNVKYEGEFKEGKRNGKGKKYKKGVLMFEGEFKDWKIWNGQGKEYISSQHSEECFFKNEEIGKEKLKEYNFLNEYIIPDGEYVN